MDQQIVQAIADDLCRALSVDDNTDRYSQNPKRRQMVEFLRDLRSGKLTVVETEEFFS